LFVETVAEINEKMKLSKEGIYAYYKGNKHKNLGSVAFEKMLPKLC